MWALILKSVFTNDERKDTELRAMQTRSLFREGTGWEDVRANCAGLGMPREAWRVLETLLWTKTARNINCGQRQVTCFWQVTEDGPPYLFVFSEFLLICYCLGLFPFVSLPSPRSFYRLELLDKKYKRTMQLLLCGTRENKHTQIFIGFYFMYQRFLFFP